MLSGSLKGKALFCFARIDGWKGSSWEAIDNMRHCVQAYHFVLSSCRCLGEGLLVLVSLCETSYVDFVHAYCLTLQKIGMPLNICEITVVECVFSCLKSSAGNQ